ncbi:Phytosulfokines 3 [Senna tora]|uniref:Phytosulfokine n=1 Tax=Senna tora TaxID=362788 RepID=A0A834WNX9_9FABA|nr:Phytosulfokines 3 [Senna tora]
MAKLFTICIFTLLLLSFGLIHASRPHVAFSSLHELNQDGVGTKAELGDENCEGVKEKDECLMRRTLEAHVDYIYTQKHKPRN